jgi:hypothetical protein
MYFLEVSFVDLNTVSLKASDCTFMYCILYVCIMNNNNKKKKVSPEEIYLILTRKIVYICLTIF